MTPPASGSIVVERELAHPPEKVWRALTDGPLVAAWLMPGDFRPVVGHHFTLRAEPAPHWDGVTHGEVLEVDPCTRLVYRWQTAGAAPDGLSTVVTWTLTPTPRGVLLRMEQAGFRPQDGPNFEGASRAWQRFMGRLEQVVAALPEQLGHSLPTP